MADAELRLRATLDDQASRDIDQLEGKLRKTGSVAADANKKIGDSAATAARTSGRSASTIARAYQNTTNRIVDAANTVRNRAKTMGTDFATGFRSGVSGAQKLEGAVSRAGAAAGRISRPFQPAVRNFLTGFRDTEAAANRASGRMGTFGGAARRAFETAAKPAGAIGRATQTSVNTAVSAIKSISGRVAGVARATGGQATQIGESLYQGIKKGTSKVDGLLSKLSGGIKNIVTSTAGKVAGIVGLGSIITLGFNRMTGIENAQAKLTGLGYSTEKVQGVMDNALASVKGTAFGLGDAVTTSVQLLAAGIEPGEQLEGVLKTVGNTAALAGSDMGEMGQIFGKVAATGKLQGDTIDQLAARGVPALQWVAEEMGVTAAQAADMASKGQISFEDFAAAMEANVGSVADIMGKTLTGRWQNFTAALGRLGAAALTPLNEPAKAVLATATDVVDRVTDLVIGAASILGNGDFTGFGDFGEMFKIEEDSALVDALFRIRNAAISAFGTARDYWTQFTGSINWGAVAGWFTDLYQAVLPLGTALRGVAAGVGEGFFNLGVAIGQAIGIIAPAVIPVISVLAQFTAKILEFITPILPTVIPVLGALFLGFKAFGIITTVIGWVNGLIGVLRFLPAVLAGIPVLGWVLLAIGALVLMYQKVGWFRDAVDAAMTWIVGAFRNAADWTVEAWRNAGDLLSGFWTWITDTATAAATWFTETVVPIWQAGVDFFTGLWSGAKDTATGLWSAVTDAATTAANWFVSNITPLWLTALAGLETAINWFKGVWNSVWEGIKFAAAIVAAALMTIWDGIVWALRTTLGPAFTWLLENVVRPVWSAIQTVVDFFRNWWSTVAVPAITAAITLLGSSWVWIRDTVAAVWTAITNKISAAWAWVRDTILNPAISFLRGALTFAWYWVRDVTSQVWTAVSTKISTTWAWVRDTILNPAISFLRGALTFAWYWVRDTVSQVWSAVSRKISTTWAWVRDTILNPAINFLRGSFTAAWTKIRDSINTVWTNIRDKISGTWNWVRDVVLTPMTNFLRNQVVNAWNAAKDGISTAWNAIKGIVDGPVDFVINTVINKGFIENFNTVAKKFGIDPLPNIAYKGLAGGGVVPGYQRRKIDDHAVPVRGGGIQPLRGGEGVLVPEATRTLGHGWVHGLNNAANSGGTAGARRFLTGLAEGGVSSPLRGQYPLTQGYNRVHKGIDIGAPSGTNLYATADGVVTHAGPGASFPGVWGGNEIHIKSGGLERWFAHLSQIGVRRGEQVKKGQLIGRTGNTGISSGPHLHFGVFRGGWPNDIDPLQYLAGAIKFGPNDGSGGDNGILSGLLDIIGFDKLLGKIPGGGFTKDLMVGAVNKAYDGFVDFAGQALAFVDHAIQGVKTGGGGLLDDPVARTRTVLKWSGTVTDALKRVGLPTDNRYKQAWLRQIQTESGGNPNAIQGIIDQNSGGQEAAGLVQVIPNTFAAHRDPTLPNNRLDPLANLVAGMRYSKARYGVEGMLNVIGKGQGYKNGVTLPGYLPGHDTIPAMLSPGEAVLTPQLTAWLGKGNIDAANAHSVGSRAGGPSAGVGLLTRQAPATVTNNIDLSVTVEGNADEDTIQKLTETLEEKLLDLLDDANRRDY